MARVRPGGIGWVEVAINIAAVDAWLLRHKRETLSEVFGSVLRHPRRRWHLIAVWSIITAHLFAELMPGRLRQIFKHVDPIARLAHLIEVASPEPVLVNP